MKFLPDHISHSFLKQKNIALLLNILVFFSFSATSQELNRNWVFGFQDSLFSEQCGTIQVEFDELGVSFKKIETPLAFESTLAAVSNAGGELLMYTNGCAIADSSHQIVLSGEDINPGSLHELVCEKYGYIVPRGAMFLPWPTGVKGEHFALIHLAAEQDGKRGLSLGPLYYSEIKKENDEFIVVEKNSLLLEKDLESFVVSRHANGRDWWLIAPEYNSPKYHRYLLSPFGFEYEGVQDVGVLLPAELCRFSGESKFSPDGNKLVRFNQTCGLQIFDFDRCSGELNNPFFERIGASKDYLGASVCFSPNSRYLYVSSQSRYENDDIWYNALFKIDLEKLGVLAQPYIKQKLPEGYRLQNLFIAPDGNIYASGGSSQAYLHVIEDPDAELDTIKLVAAELPLPVINARTFPYFPNYSLGSQTGSLCDTLVSIDQGKEIISRKIDVFPNPFDDQFEIIVKSEQILDAIDRIELISPTGQVLINKKIGRRKSLIIHTDNIEQGTYYLHCYGKDFKKVLKVLKIDSK